MLGRRVRTSTARAFFHFESNFEPEELNLFSLMFFRCCCCVWASSFSFLFSIYSVLFCVCVLFSLHRLGARSEFRQGHAAIKYIKINGYRVIRPTSHKRTNTSTKNHTQIHTILCRMMLRTFFEHTSRSDRAPARERERESVHGLTVQAHHQHGRIYLWC